MSNYKSFFSASQSTIALTKKKSSYVPVGENNRNKKLTDAQVREMRIKFRDGVSRVQIFADYPNVSILTLEKIITYNTRLSPSCDI
jgi:hypothetical protein